MQSAINLVYQDVLADERTDRRALFYGYPSAESAVPVICVVFAKRLRAFIRQTLGQGLCRMRVAGIVMLIWLWYSQLILNLHMVKPDFDDDIANNDITRPGAYNSVTPHALMGMLWNVRLIQFD